MSRQLPWLKVKMAPVNIERLQEEHIPEKPGVYIMLSDHTEYVYPWSDKNGSSGVYYIGRSNNLRTRLKTHKRYCSQRISDRDRSYYWPFYEYAAHHGCNVVWIISMNHKDTEKELLVAFANYYGAKPVANGQSGWPPP
ncbi:MAG: hypothetical protein V1894_01250 [Chloroflexota bacterium]